MCYRVLSCVYSFNQVLALDEYNAAAHHYLGCIQWLRLQGDVHNVDVREACLRHLIQVCYHVLITLSP